MKYGPMILQRFGRLKQQGSAICACTGKQMKQCPSDTPLGDSEGVKRLVEALNISSRVRLDWTSLEEHDFLLSAYADRLRK